MENTQATPATETTTETPETNTIDLSNVNEDYFEGFGD